MPNRIMKAPGIDIWSGKICRDGGVPVSDEWICDTWNEMSELLTEIIHYKQVRSGMLGKIIDYAVPSEVIEKARALLVRLT